MTFDNYKRQVFKLAKAAKVSHLVPNSDTLFRLWEQKVAPETVVTLHCTLEAQKKRHV